VERGLPHPNTPTIQLPAVFIGLRPTGLPCTVKEFALQIMSAQLRRGAQLVSRAEIALAIRNAGGSVSRSGLKVALTELMEGSAGEGPSIERVAPASYRLLR
jgi:hypothetical protein